MNERQEFLDNRICRTISTIDDISYYMNNAEDDFRNGTHLETFRQIMLDCARRLAKCSVQCREYFLTLSADRKTEQEKIDTNVAEHIDISIKQIEYREFSAYKITLPVLLPQKYGKVGTYKDMWLNCFKAAVERYCSKNNVIERIDNPGIAFVHRFTKYTDNQIVKDTDNYDVSLVMNMLQTYFISDDRNASLYRCNKHDASESCTEVFIMDKRKMGLFITALHR